MFIRGLSLEKCTAAEFRRAIKSWTWDFSGLDQQFQGSHVTLCIQRNRCRSPGLHVSEMILLGLGFSYFSIRVWLHTLINLVQLELYFLAIFLNSLTCALQCMHGGRVDMNVVTIKSVVIQHCTHFWDSSVAASAWRTAISYSSRTSVIFSASWVQID